jgi:hypothetical protein
MKNIIVIGDSHLAGAELKLEKNSAWPALVEKKTGITVKNFSKGATSNDRNMRLLPEILMGVKDNLVIYGLTSWLRTEIFYEKDYYPIGFNFKDIMKNNWLDMTTEHIKANNLYIDHLLQSNIDEMNNNNYKILNHLIYVESLCKRFADNYFFFQTMPDLIPTNIKKQSAIYKALDKEKFIKFENFDNWYDWCGFNNFSKGKMGHYLDDAHEKFSDLFIQRYIT